jgi:hypothetical protein
MHVVNELEADAVIFDDQEYEEVVEVVEEGVLAVEEVQGPPTDPFDAVPTQGKPRCITLILRITLYI